ncbi:TPA: hypothetical protein DEG21_00375 [Patescibacteria group bacterium]|nr:hypothetical protein [Candidatus Gracilibacteria bacterium]
MTFFICLNPKSRPSVFKQISCTIFCSVLYSEFYKVFAICSYSAEYLCQYSIFSILGICFTLEFLEQSVIF